MGGSWCSPGVHELCQGRVEWLAPPPPLPQVAPCMPPHHQPNPTFPTVCGLSPPNSGMGNTPEGSAGRDSWRQCLKTAGSWLQAAASASWHTPLGVGWCQGMPASPLSLLTPPGHSHTPKGRVCRLARLGDEGKQCRHVAMHGWYHSCLPPSPPLAATPP